MSNENQTETSQRKKDHIDLAFSSQVGQMELDQRFYYEPMLAAHPNEEDKLSTPFGNKNLGMPLWISSMTGGTEHAGSINKNLAKACRQFGLGMGLGSCRIILEDDTYFEDFNLRPIIGDAFPFYANLGIAQLENLLHSGKKTLINNLVDRLQADGLIIHVNPMQEWLQPEGDLIKSSPIELIQRSLDSFDFPIIVKEVGQGFGPKSMEKLLALPLAAVDFGAAGGTNFAKLELSRANDLEQNHEKLMYCGHNATEMMAFVANIVQHKNQINCKQLIVSGGIKDYLDGHYFIEKSPIPAIYAQASVLLRYALHSYDMLEAYLQTQVEGLKMARKFLIIKND